MSSPEVFWAFYHLFSPGLESEILGFLVITLLWIVRMVCVSTRTHATWAEHDQMRRTLVIKECWRALLAVPAFLKLQREGRFRWIRQRRPTYTWSASQKCRKIKHSLLTLTRIMHCRTVLLWDSNYIRSSNSRQRRRHGYRWSHHSGQMCAQPWIRSLETNFLHLSSCPPSQLHQQGCFHHQ